MKINSGDKVIVLDELKYVKDNLFSADIHTVAFNDGIMVTLMETRFRYTVNQLKKVE